MQENRKQHGMEHIEVQAHLPKDIVNEAYPNSESEHVFSMTMLQHMYNHGVLSARKIIALYLYKLQYYSS